MSEQAAENPNQAVQPGAGEDEQTAESTTAQPPAQAQTTASSDEQTFPIRLVKRPTGDTHWNTAAGVMELVRHAETGEPTMEYALLGTIDGVDVTLQTYNAGGVETIIRSAQQSQQQQSSGA